ncbi:sulfur globule family protein [Zavarzinella formosa]|uniref:sulfur globule family protein n=1 Tax=Zavarzinella formosa TaxID=360055 RepID=UPI00030A1444|nr:sulfur globule family protein [Zavarzinella formosa]
MPNIARVFAGLLVLASWTGMARAEATITTGSIESINLAKGELVMVASGKGRITIRIPKEVKIRLEGRTAELTDLKPGQKLYAIGDKVDPRILVLQASNPEPSGGAVVRTVRPVPAPAVAQGNYPLGGGVGSVSPGGIPPYSPPPVYTPPYQSPYPAGGYGRPSGNYAPAPEWDENKAAVAFLAKLLAAHILDQFAKENDQTPGFEAVLVGMFARMARDAVIENALVQVMPNEKPWVISGVKNIITLHLDGELTRGKLAVQMTKDEMMRYLEQKNPNLATQAKVVGFLLEFHNRMVAQK